MSRITSDFLVEAEQFRDVYQNAEVVFIDVRDSNSYQNSHIPGAFNVPEVFDFLASSTDVGVQEFQDFFLAKFRQIGLSGREFVVFYEEAMNTGLGRSCRGYLISKYLGYPNVSVLNGGFVAWKNLGLPVDTTIERGSDQVSTQLEEFLESNDSTTLVTAEQMLRSLGDSSIIKLDVRGSKEWKGLSSSPLDPDICPRKGRIPGAVWIDWSSFIDLESSIPSIKSNENILEICKHAGIFRDSTVYAYCFKGSRAASSFVAMRKAGIRNVSVYLASWNEWSRNSTLPVDEAILA